MKVVSIGTVTNDNISYSMWLDVPFSQPSSRISQTRREGRAPLITSVQEEPLQLALNIRVGGDTEAETKALREALFTTLDTKSTAIAFVVSDEDDGDVRYRYVVVQAVDEQQDEEGPGMKLVATLITHLDGHWRSTTNTSISWVVDASEETTVVNNPGSLPVHPTYTFRPTIAKSGGGGWYFTYRRFCAVKWGGPTVEEWPTNITDGIWDTQTLISAFKINQFGDGDYTQNIGVVVDGVPVPRWVEGINTSDTSVWANLDWSYVPSNTLAVALDSGGVVTQITIDFDIHLFPYRGILLIEDELFTYTSTDTSTQTFHGVERAMKDSSAAAHAIGAVVQLIQHDIWLVYGYTGRGITNDLYEPMITLSESTNASWRFDYFGQSALQGPPRPLAWLPVGPTSSVGTEGDPFSELVLLNGSWLSGTSVESLWVLHAPGTVASMRLIGRARNWEPGQVWQTGLYAGGGAYIPIPELESTDLGLIDFDLSVTETRWMDDLRFYQRCGGSVEVRMDTLILTWSQFAYAVMFPEINVYDLDLELENVTTGLSMTLSLSMALDGLLEVNTEEFTVRLLDDGSNQYQALSRNTRRRDLLPLIPGDNTLRATESGLQGVTILVEFEARSYS